MDGAREVADSALRLFTDLATVRGAEGITAEEFDGIVLANQRRVFIVNLEARSRGARQEISRIRVRLHLVGEIPGLQPRQRGKAPGTD